MLYSGLYIYKSTQWRDDDRTIRTRWNNYNDRSLMCCRTVRWICSTSESKVSCEICCFFTVILSIWSVNEEINFCLLFLFLKRLLWSFDGCAFDIRPTETLAPGARRDWPIAVRLSDQEAAVTEGRVGDWLGTNWATIAVVDCASIADESTLVKLTSTQRD